MKECRREGDDAPLGGDKYIQTHLYPTPRGNDDDDDDLMAQIL